MRLKFVDVRPIADSQTTLERRWTKSLWAVFTSKKSCRLSKPVRSLNSILTTPRMRAVLFWDIRDLEGHSILSVRQFPLRHD